MVKSKTTLAVWAEIKALIPQLEECWDMMDTIEQNRNCQLLKMTAETICQRKPKDRPTEPQLLRALRDGLMASIEKAQKEWALMDEAEQTRWHELSDTTGLAMWEMFEDIVGLLGLLYEEPAKED